MKTSSGHWDYLVLTAANALQAAAYEDQLRVRRQAGLLPGIGRVLVVPDIQGKRIGSGGSTLSCLIEILRRERSRQPIDFRNAASVREALGDLRILIVHAGGDSRRLPAYGPCGKIFVPLPGAADAPLPPALFDRLVPAFLALPQGLPGRGQIVVAAGDALIQFDPALVEFLQPGLIALGCYAGPEEASRHGVFCLGTGGAVSRYLQKPPVEIQRAAGALDPRGRAALDIGVMHMDAAAAAALLLAFGAEPAAGGSLDFTAEARGRILLHGLDLYREICCGLGSSATAGHYIESARASGSLWPEDRLARIYPRLRDVPFHVQIVPACRFLHFGSTRQLIDSGLALAAEDGRQPSSTILAINTVLGGRGRISGAGSWVEACRVRAHLALSGRNVVAGVDVDAPLSLPAEACLEVLPGRGRSGADVWFVRCYGVGDGFKHSLPDGGRFCGRPLPQWLEAARLGPEDVWPGTEDPAGRSLWNARVFPAVREASEYRRWLWMYSPESARGEELRALKLADRYSAAEIATLADQHAFHRRRTEIWADLARPSCRDRLEDPREP